MRYLIALTFAAMVVVALPSPAAAAGGYCQPGLLNQWDMAGAYESFESQIRVTVYPCNAVIVLWSNEYGTHEALYHGVESLDGGGFIARLAVPDPMVRSLDGRNVIDIKPAEPGWVQVITAGPFADNMHIYRLQKIR